MSAATDETVRDRMREREKAKRFFASLSRHDKCELGDALVLGGFDWREWLRSKPTRTFLNELDEQRILWEITDEGD